MPAQPTSLASRRMNLEVSPPISKMVCVSGCSAPMPRVMALNSFSKAASSAGATRRPPEPVTRAPRTVPSGSTASSSSRSDSAASAGLPLMRRYAATSNGASPTSVRPSAGDWKSSGCCARSSRKSPWSSAWPTSAALRLMQPISMPSVVMGVRRGPPWGARSPADCKDYQCAGAPGKPGRKRRLMESRFAVNAGGAGARRRRRRNVSPPADEGHPGNDFVSLCGRPARS